MKLQLKLHSACRNNIPWNQKLFPEEENFWKIKLTQFVRFHELSAPRCTTLPDSDSISGLSDAGATAGGAAVYAGQIKRWLLDLQPAIIKIKNDEGNNP